MSETTQEQAKKIVSRWRELHIFSFDDFEKQIADALEAERKRAETAERERDTLAKCKHLFCDLEPVNPASSLQWNYRCKSHNFDFVSRYGIVHCPKVDAALDQKDSA